MSREAYPLSWPDGWKRTGPGSRRHAQFSKTRDPKYITENGQTRRVNQGMRNLSVADAVGRILAELSRMGIGSDDVLISTNVKLRLDGLPRSDQEPSDPGAAVYWQKRGQQMRCMAIDQYYRVADNLAAIAATLDAMRAIERHGGAAILDRAFKGFAALPEKASQHWRNTLGISPDVKASIDLVEDRFRALAHVHHPDKGGDPEKFMEIQQAREAARLELS
jgi:hypothetical protein